MEHRETLEEREAQVKAYAWEVGREEGRVEEREEIIQTLLSNGVEPEFIAKSLNLSLEEVEAIGKKHHPST